VKARKAMEMELQDLQSQFEALSKSKQEVGWCMFESFMHFNTQVEKGESSTL